MALYPRQNSTFAFDICLHCSRCFRSANIISKRPVQERNHLKGIWEKETTYILIYLEHFSWQKKGDICTKFREFTEKCLAYFKSTKDLKFDLDQISVQKGCSVHVFHAVILKIQLSRFTGRKKKPFKTARKNISA